MNDSLRNEFETEATYFVLERTSMAWRATARGRVLPTALVPARPDHRRTCRRLL